MGTFAYARIPSRKSAASAIHTYPKIRCPGKVCAHAPMRPRAYCYLYYYHKIIQHGFFIKIFFGRKNHFFRKIFFRKGRRIGAYAPTCPPYSFFVYIRTTVIQNRTVNPLHPSRFQKNPAAFACKIKTIVRMTNNPSRAQLSRTALKITCSNYLSW